MLKIGHYISYAAVVSITVMMAFPAAAEMVVVSSTDAAYPIGNRLEDGAKVDLMEGKRLALKDLRTGKTYLLKGPYKGLPSQYKPKARNAPRGIEYARPNDVE